MYILVIASHHLILFIVFFFFNDTATTEIYTLSLHDALPIYGQRFPLRPRGKYLDGQWASRPPVGCRNSRRGHHGQRRRQLFRYCRSAARGPRVERLGPHALEVWSPRNGSSKIRRRGPVAALAEILVVRLRRGTWPGG